jgi:acetylornithine deacetylase/succinyl-diaminopimelate desuccinylase-like protein
MNLTEFIEGRREQHLKELCEFLRIPSVSAKSEHKSDVEKGAR